MHRSGLIEIFDAQGVVRPHQEHRGLSTIDGFVHLNETVCVSLPEVDMNALTGA